MLTENPKFDPIFLLKLLRKRHLECESSDFDSRLGIPMKDKKRLTSTSLVFSSASKGNILIEQKR